MKDLIIIGVGGLGRETAWHVERINSVSPEWNIIGFMDDDEKVQDQIINGYKVVGKTVDIALYKEAYYVCAIGNSVIREKVINRIKSINPEIRFATIIDPSVKLSDLVTIGAGSIICTNSSLTVNISIGEHVIIDVNCTVGHDAVLNEFVTLHPGVNISGNTEIGRGSELGTGMQIIQGKTIGKYSIIGAGAVVVDDIPDKCTAVGVPARVIKIIE